jgi:hypothetical protein
MSRRLKITLPEAVATQLDELVANTGEPAARLAGQMVRQGIAEAASGEDVRPPRVELASVLPDAPENGEPNQRAPWLEPYGGDREWRSWMWGGIVALHGRYPTTPRRIEARLVEERGARGDPVRHRRMASVDRGYLP